MKKFFLQVVAAINNYLHRQSAWDGRWGKSDGIQLGRH